MAGRYSIVPASLDHIPGILANVRQADIDELDASHGTTPGEAMRMGIEISLVAWTGFVDGEPICMFGVSPISAISGVGCPWMIGTNLIDKHWLGFLRRCKPVVDAMFSLCPRLINYVDVRNKKAMLWLKWLGFTFDPPQPFGVKQMPFMRFEQTRGE